MDSAPGVTVVGGEDTAPLQAARATSEERSSAKRSSTDGTAGEITGLPGVVVARGMSGRIPSILLKGPVASRRITAHFVPFILQCTKRCDNIARFRHDSCLRHGHQPLPA